jgi:sugar O-acyltransferase (sialic acid O-acetyltransferase NeuD family)
VSKEPIILIGGGGHCRACIDVIEQEGRFQIAGIVDAPDKLHEEVLGYEIIANDNDLPDLVKQYENFFVTIGCVKDLSRRIEMFDYLKKLDVDLPVIVSPLAHVAKGVRIQEGTMVFHKAVLNSNACVGVNCIINTMALIEHDAQVGDHTHISTGSLVNGTCQIGNRVFLGSQSVVVNDKDVTDDALIGAGTVVHDSITEPGTYVGNPASKIG